MSETDQVRPSPDRRVSISRRSENPEATNGLTSNIGNLREFYPLYPPGDQNYWRADFVNALSDNAIALHVEHGSRLPTPQSGMHLYPIDGAVHRVGRVHTAFSYRDARWAGVTFAVDPDPSKAELLRTWTIDYWEALHPYSAGGAYVNFMMEEGQSRVHATYRDNLERLSRIKSHYDPGNLFRVNQNILPMIPVPHPPVPGRFTERRSANVRKRI